MCENSTKCGMCGAFIPVVDQEMWKTSEGECIPYDITEMVIICVNTSLGELEMCEICYKHKYMWHVFTTEDLMSIYTEFGLEYCMREMYSEAGVAFESGLSLGENDKMCFGLANVYGHMGRNELAKKLYIRTLEINPNHTYAQHNLSTLDV